MKVCHEIRNVMKSILNTYGALTQLPPKEIFNHWFQQNSNHCDLDKTHFNKLLLRR